MNWAQVGPTPLSGLTFDASFDGGNCSNVEQTDDSEFTLYTAPDCADTPFEKGFRTWFQFSVRGVAKGRYACHLRVAPGASSAPDLTANSCDSRRDAACSRLTSRT